MFFFSSANFALLAGFFGIGAAIGIGQEMLCLPFVGFFKNVVQNSLKKI